jgi:hypothetical protein
MTKPLSRKYWITANQIYEDCGGHPVLCISATPVKWPSYWPAFFVHPADIELKGISLLDGSERKCSARQCDVTRMSLKSAVATRKIWLDYEAERSNGVQLPPWGREPARPGFSA